MFAKFSYQIWTHAISSPRSQILQRTGTSCLSNFGTHATFHDYFESTSTKQYNTKFFMS